MISPIDGQQVGYPAEPRNRRMRGFPGLFATGAKWFRHRDAYFAVSGTTKQFTCLARRTYRGLARRARAWAAGERGIASESQPFSASWIKSQACRHNGDTPPGRARLRLRALPVSRAVEEITGADPGLEQLAHEMRGPRLLGTDANCGAAQVGEASERAVTPSKQDQQFRFRQWAEDFDTRVRGHRGAVLHDRERIGAAPAFCVSRATFSSEPAAGTTVSAPRPCSAR